MLANRIVLCIVFCSALFSFSMTLPISKCFGQCFVQRDPSRMSSREAKQFNDGYPFRYDSFIAETYPNRVGDSIKAPPRKIEHALASIGLPTDRHDMNHGSWGKQIAASPVPGKRARLERQKYSENGAEKQLRYYPTEADSYLAEFSSRHVGDAIYSHPNKIMNGMAKIGVDTDKHDMYYGRWGKPAPGGIRLKEQYWWVTNDGQKLRPSPEVHEDLPKASQLGIVKAKPVSGRAAWTGSVASRTVREPRKEKPPRKNKA